MFYVALVNETDRKIYYSEGYKTEQEAVERIVYGLEPQAALNEAGGGEPAAKGKKWYAWGPGDKPFTFNELEV